MTKRLENKIKKAISKLGFKTFDGEYGLSIERDTYVDALDYYGEYTGGYPWINPVLVKLAKDNGCYWEWVNPGAIVLAE